MFKFGLLVIIVADLISIAVFKDVGMAVTVTIALGVMLGAIKMFNKEC